MTTPSLDALLKIAEAATPGPWYANDRMVSSRPTGSGDVAVAQPDHKAEYANAAHIAAFNPTVAQALVRGMQVLVTCGEKFREYEALHAAKPDLVKARRNAEMAEQCEAALSALTAALKGSSHA